MNEHRSFRNVQEVREVDSVEVCNRMLSKGWWKLLEVSVQEKATKYVLGYAYAGSYINADDEDAPLACRRRGDF